MEKRDIQDIILDLKGFSMQDPNPLKRLGALTDEVLASGKKELALPEMLRIIERYPEEELGSPGPLVFAIEKCNDYEIELLASLQQQPATLTVWMLYRLAKKKQQHSYIEALKSLSTHPKATDLVKEDIEILLSWLINNEINF